MQRGGCRGVGLRGPAASGSTGTAVSEAKVWSDDVPELAVATVPEMRGSGVGTRLLEALVEAVRGKHATIALSSGTETLRSVSTSGLASPSTEGS